MDVNRTFILRFLTFVICNGEIKERIYNVYHNKRIDSQHIFLQTKAHSRNLCAVYCADVLTCWAVGYHNKSDSCQMSSRSPQSEANILVDDADWLTLHRDDRCYDGWKEGTNSCYLFADMSLNWSAAQDYCKAFDSCLVEIDDAEENNLLKSFLKSKYQHHKTGARHSIIQDNYYWIGTRGSGSNFFWSSSGSIVNFTDWTSPPTWAFGHSFDNHCVEMVQINGWSWSYIKCNSSQPFVCERPIN